MYEWAEIAPVVFYTAAITVVLGFGVINVGLDNRVGALYAALFALMLLVLWVWEGGLAVRIPAMTGAQTLRLARCLVLLATALGYFTAERAIDPGHAAPRLRRALRWLAGVSLLAIAPAALIDGVAPGLLVLALLLGMMAAQVVSTRTWRRLDDRSQPLAVLAASLSLAGIVLAVLFAASFRQRGTVWGFSPAQLVYAVVVLASMLSIGVIVRDVRRARDRAQQDALETARRDARTSAALLQMERQYGAAREAVSRQQRRLRAVSHDINQPIASMRAELDALRPEVDARQLTRLDRVLDHLHELTRRYVRDDGAAETAPAAGPGAIGGEPSEDVPASLLLSTLDRLFGGEARAKGIDLRLRPSSAVLHAPTVSLIRIASNLLANAISHAQASRILVAIARREDAFTLCVFDNGRGVPAEFARSMFRDGVRGEDSDGSGQGLTIALDLAHELGSHLRYRSLPRGGSAFCLQVPAAH